MPSRTEISLRLKAARWLYGTVDAKGNATPVSVKKLVARPPLEQNGISKNRVEDIEQMKVDARPMELEKLAEALEIPSAWFFADDWRDLISEEAAADASPEVIRLKSQRSVLLSTIARVRSELEDLQKRQPPP